MDTRFCKLLLATTAFAAMFPASAIAQDASAQPAGSPPQSQPPGAVPVESGQIADIVVTAQRRSANVQSIPIAVTAMDGETLAEMGVRGAADVALVSPSVTFQKSAGGAGITIRGIGGAQTATDESVAGVYLDGVYIPSPHAAFFQLVDIERIEVLRGPQGTLFGRNSSSGAIQIITREPDDELRATASFGIANYNTIETSGSLSGPIANNLFASVAGYYQEQKEGWGRNLISGRKTYFGHNAILRGKLRWTPSEATEVTLTGNISRVRPDNLQGSGILPGQRSTAGDVYPGFYNNNLNVDTRNNVKQEIVSLTVSHDLGPVRLLSISSAQWFTQPFVVDSDVTRLPNLMLDFGPGSRRRSVSQEFQLQSDPSSPVKWVAGLFYFRERHDIDSLNATGPLGVLLSTTVSDRTVNAYAAFGEATIPLGESTNLTAGLRYGIDKHERNIAIIRPTGTTNCPSGGPITIACPISGTATDKALTWRFALDRQFTPTILGYASYSRGFKSGLFSLSSTTAPYTRPQSVDTFEAGLKTDLFDRHVRFNITAFYNKFEDIQLRAFGTFGVSNFINAGKAHTEGVEIDFIVKPVAALTLRGGATYLHGKYTEFIGAPFFEVIPAGGLRQFPGDATGNKTVNTPPFSFNLGASYDIPTSVGDFRLNATYQYAGGSYFDPQNRIELRTYGLLNGEIGWTSPQGSLNARLWIRNVTDEHYIAAINSGTTGDIYQPSTPRTYGVTVGWSL